MADLWTELFSAVSAGRAVQVALAPSDWRRKPKRKSSGRPRVRGTTKYGHYAGYDPAVGTRPRCEHRGCNKYLQRDRALGCCDEHEQAVIAEAEAKLARVRKAA